MQDRPTPDELLEAVIAFLRGKAVELLPPRESFEARVAASALETIRREIGGGARAQEDERQRLVALLDMQSGDIEQLNRELCARIADGRVNLSTPGLREHLWATASEKLAVDQPRYSTYVRARQEKRL